MSQIDAIALDAGELPTLPDVAMQVLKLAGDDDANTRELERVLQRDQGLAARVLRLSNSAHFGMRRTVSTLSHAVVLLGLRRLRSIVLVACTESLCRSRRSSFKDRILWQHSVATGVAARVLAERVAPSSAEEAFVGGLLHDIGKMVLDGSRSVDYGSVVQRVYNQRERFIDVEQELFGFDHGDVGGLVAEKWGLTDSLREAIALHHDPSGAVVNPTLSSIVSLANGLCVKLEIGPEKLPELELGSLAAVGCLGLDAAELELLLADVQVRIEAEQSTFDA